MQYPFCPKCGVQLDSSTRYYCRYCGARLDSFDISLNAPYRQRKSPSAAATCSLFCPGLGQVYSTGSTGKGLLFLIGTIVGLAFFTLPGVAIYIYGIYDAYKSANGVNQGIIPYSQTKAGLMMGFVIFAFFIGIILSAIIAGFIFGMTANQSNYSNYYSESMSYMNESEQNHIIDQVLPLIASNQDIDSRNIPSIKGGVILYQTGAYQNSSYYYNNYDFWIPDNLKAKTTDKVITIILMVDERYQEVGIWISNKTGERLKGYKKYTDVFLIYWPENRIVGKYTVIGDEPKEEEEVYFPHIITWEENVGGRILLRVEKGIVGDERVDNWILSLSRDS